MSIQVTAQGTILGKPEYVESDRGEVVAFMLGTRQRVQMNRQQIIFDGLPTCEVVCLDQLAGQVLELPVGAGVTVTGELDFLIPPGADPDAGTPVGRLEIHAVAVVSSEPNDADVPETVAAPSVHA